MPATLLPEVVESKNGQHPQGTFAQTFATLDKENWVWHFVPRPVSVSLRAPALLLTLFSFCLFILGFWLGKVSNDQSSDLTFSRAEAKKARDMYGKVAADSLQWQTIAEELKEVFLTHRHREAFRLVTVWKRICEEIPTELHTDEGQCTKVLSKSYPKHNLRLRVLEEPEPMINEARISIESVCQSVPNDKPLAHCSEFQKKPGRH